MKLTPWQLHLQAIARVEEQRLRVVDGFAKQKIDYCFVGGVAVAMWVGSIDEAAVRTTNNVDILLRRSDLPKAKAAAATIDMDYFEVMGVGMFLERVDPNPRKAVHLIWAGEKVRPEYPLPSPSVDDRAMLEPGQFVVSLEALVRMKLMAFRDQDRVHLRDMIDVGLVDRKLQASLPAELAARLEPLLFDAGK